MVALRRQTPQPHGGRSEPRRPGLGLGGRRGQHGDQAIARHAVTGRGHAGVAEERALADAHATQPHPPRVQLVGRDHRVIGEERAVFDARQRRQQKDGGCLDVTPDAGAEQAQPHRGEQARVQREEDRARGIQQPLDRPRLPADATAHGVDALVQPDRQQAYSDDDSDREDETGDDHARHEPRHRPAERRSERVRPRDAAGHDERTDREGCQRQQREHDGGCRIGPEPPGGSGCAINRPLRRRGATDPLGG